ncbi:MAG: hypothetical protein VR72_17685 [Clostridiaceae bacterium BRH_c20a]|nr:MAG: hypothetical protein VR72_17685 [Clostridiaceae bacterium BRH_c20a]
MTKKAGVVGIGLMGSGMAQNLLKGGYDVWVYDVNQEAIDDLTTKGARKAKSPREIGENSDVVLMSLPAVSIVEEAVLGDEGLLKGLKEGSYIIDLSTIDPVTTRRIHNEAKAKGVKTLDAPVSGGPQGAAAGTLSIMVGGDETDFEACKEIFSVIGKNVFHVGPIGAGQTIKLCNNALASVHTVALGEVLLTGVRAGVKLDKLVEVISNSSGDCWILRNFFPKTVLVDKYDPPLFTLNLMHKDVGLYIKTAEEMGVTSIITSLAYQMYKAGKATEKGQLDHTSVVKMVEELSNGKIGTINS